MCTAVNHVYLLITPSEHTTPITGRPLQGYLAHKKTPTPQGPPYDPKHRPTVGS